MSLLFYDGVPRSKIGDVRDKTVSGKYALANPPKKPGGQHYFGNSSKMCLSVATFLASAEFAEGDSTVEAGHTESESTWSKWRVIMILFAMLLVAFLFLLYRLGLECEHEEQFEYAVGVLIERLGINPQQKSSLRSELWKRYNDDVFLWIEKDPRRRISHFLQGIE